MPPPIHPSTNRSGVRLCASPRSSAIERADGLVRWPLCRSVSLPGVSATTCGVSSSSRFESVRVDHVNAAGTIDLSHYVV